ncbi:MAG: cytochrome P460 family protein [Alphaproteobacteria bacterium]|nr:cytochrome P460 family protein [Alphaproteobacteria bacterium]
MKNVTISAALLATALIAVLGGVALAQQDRSALRIPDGLTFAEFKGYESLETVTVTQNEGRLKIIAANPAMMRAFKSGLPADGQAFPEGSRIVKLEYMRTVDQTSPAGPIAKPNGLQAIEFIVKDTKRFPNTKGWAYAFFANDPAKQTTTPLGSGTICGFACHGKVAGQDYIFNRYAPR